MENYPILEKWCFIITEITVLPMFLYKFNITSIKKYSPRIFFLEFKKLKLRLDLKSVCQLEQNCDLKKAVCWHPLKKLIHYHWASPTHFYLIYAMWNKDLGLLSHPVSKRAKKGHLHVTFSMWICWQLIYFKVKHSLGKIKFTLWFYLAHRQAVSFWSLEGWQTFCKGSDSRYFRLCRPYTASVAYSCLFLHH